MILAITLAALWFIAANVIAMMPSKDNHWRSAYTLIAVGIPVLGYVTLTCGPWIGMLVLLAAMSMLRWPVVHLSRHLRRSVRR